MSKIISAHQPNFLPYLGFFDKMKKSDLFVIRDEVLYVKKDYHRRNRIRVNSHDNINEPKDTWLSVPVEDAKDYIKYVKIKNDSIQKNQLWNDNILKDIKSSYKSSPFFNEFYPDIELIFKKNYECLIDLNMNLIYYLKEKFNISTPIVFASELELKPRNYCESNASEDLVSICKKLEGDIYLSGDGGKGYLDVNPFNREKIDLIFQNFKHPTYKQVFPGFLPNMCSLDALFCYGGYPEDEENR